MTSRAQVRATSPGRVLRLALIAWGLGDLALGLRTRAVGWLAGEVLGAILVAYLVIGLGDTSWYLVPFVAGIGFLAVWAAQAIRAFGRAQHAQGAIAPTPARSSAAAVAWLSLPLLIWGTGFWLVAGSAAGPSAVVDAFETSWPQAARGLQLDRSLALDTRSTEGATIAIRHLRDLCAAGELSDDCADAPANLLRDVRFTISVVGPDTATATAQVVSFERRPSHFLGLFPTTDLVAVPQETVLLLELRAVDAPLPGGLEVGAQRWRIVSARAP